MVERSNLEHLKCALIEKVASVVFGGSLPNKTKALLWMSAAKVSGKGAARCQNNQLPLMSMCTPCPFLSTGHPALLPAPQQQGSQPECDTLRTDLLINKLIYNLHEE